MVLALSISLRIDNLTKEANFSYLMAEWVVNTLVLVLWKYVTYLQRRMHFTLGRYHVREQTLHSQKIVLFV